MNARLRSKEILDTALAAFKRITGLPVLVIDEPQSAVDRGVDALIKIQTDRGERKFAVEIKAVDRFQTPAQVKAQLGNHRELPLLVAPFISRETAGHCRNLHLSFLDTAGNAYLDAPGLYVYITGQPRPKDARESNFRAVGAAGLQVTFALLSRPELIRAPYREIAHDAAAALGTITHVMRDLEARGFLTSEQHRSMFDPRRLLEEWVTHYPIALRPKLHPRRFEASREQLTQADLRSLGACWGGELAAERFTQFLKPADFTIYTHKPVNRLVAALRLRANPTGNVEVLDAFWNFEPDPKYPDLVPPVLAYADLLATRDGRNIEAANLIYEQHIEPAFRALKTAH
ncbi:MAG: type IV toxin-antitoxin system AbiEi family antitoxin [Bryobacteraceae bacterium]|jgi:hypothetical protein